MAGQPLDVQDAAGNQRAPLGFWNWFIVGAFVVNLVGVGLGTSGVIGIDNKTASEKYAHLLTPAVPAFSIWFTVIFPWEFAFVIAQLTPCLRGRKVLPVIAPWWAGACVFQAAWAIAFALEFISVSTVFMTGILGSLLGLMWCVDLHDMSCLEFIFLRVGFSAHGAWVLCATGLNVMTQVVALGERSVVLELSWTVVTVVIIFAVATHLALGISKPDPIVPLVAAWATYWINQELAEAKQLNNVEREFYVKWNPDTIKGVAKAAEILQFVALLLSALSLALRLYRRCCRCCRCCGAPSPQKAQEQEDLVEI